MTEVYSTSQIYLRPSPTASANVTPIFSLPFELLHEVFLSQDSFLVARNSSLSRRQHACSPDHGPYHPHAWMVVAHICRHWRMLALACPSLWSRFTVSIHPTWTMELLHRSANMPLSIKYHLSSEGIQQANRLHSFAMILGHLSRIERLEIIQESSFPLPPAIVGMLSGRAPQLRSLFMSGFLFVPEWNAQSRATYIPPLLHPDNTPHLEEIALSGPYGGIQLAGPFASTLKHLDIRSVAHASFAQWPDTVALLDSLAAAPLLETLSFERRQTRTIISHSENLKHARLPHLHTLTLAAEDDEIVKLLDHLDLPALRCLEISTKLVQLDASAFASGLHGKIATLGAMDGLSVEVYPSARRSNTPSLHINGCAAGVEPAVSMDEHTQNKIFVLNVQKCETAMQLAGEFCRRMVVRDVRSLEMEAYDIPASVWTVVLEPMHGLTRLIVGGQYAAIHLAEALHPRRLGTPAEDTVNTPIVDTTGYNFETTRLPVPALRCLQLDRACLDRRADYDTGALGACSRDLCASLEARSEAGLHLEELSLDGCFNANEATLNALRDVVEQGGGLMSVTACRGTMDTGFWDAII